MFVPIVTFWQSDGFQSFKRFLWKNNKTFCTILEIWQILKTELISQLTNTFIDLIKTQPNIHSLVNTWIFWGEHQNNTEVFSCLVIDIYRILIMLNQQCMCVCYNVFSFRGFDSFASYSQKPQKNDSRSFSKIIQDMKSNCLSASIEDCQIVWRCGRTHRSQISVLNKWNNCENS